MAVKNYLVENMAVNNLWVCNIAEMKYKVQNKLCFQNMVTNVETVRTTTNKKAIGLMAQLMKLCQQHLSCLRRCFCFSS